MFSRAVLALALAGSAAAGPATTLASFPGTTINAAQVDVSGNIYVAGLAGLPVK